MATRKGRRRKAGGKPSAGSIWPWSIAAVLVIGGIVAYDNRAHIPALSSASGLLADARTEPKPAKPRAKPEKMIRHVPIPDIRPHQAAKIPTPVSLTTPMPVSDAFFYCGPSRSDNCIVDGDTFWLAGRKIGIADIDAPDTTTARCDAERFRGFDARERLRVLLSAGTFDLTRWAGPVREASGREMHVVSRGGLSIGGQLAAEGLARTWDGTTQRWC